MECGFHALWHTMGQPILCGADVMDAAVRVSCCKRPQPADGRAFRVLPEDRVPRADQRKADGIRVFVPLFYGAGSSAEGVFGRDCVRFAECLLRRCDRRCIRLDVPSIRHTSDGTAGKRVRPSLFDMVHVPSGCVGCTGRRRVQACGETWHANAHNG